MKIYINKHKELILAPEKYEKYGGISNEIMQIKRCEFTAEVEREIKEAMQEIIERWQPFIENVPADELFAERQKQISKFNDYETALTDLIEGEFSRYE